MTYYAVIFSSKRTPVDEPGYAAMAARMEELAKTQSGFLGIESARDANGFGITVSYWKTLDDIASWKKHAEHVVAQNLGRKTWYESFTTRVCKVERESRT